MSQTILLKRSAVPGRVPTVSDLEVGELALNVFDGVLYYIRDNGSQEVIAVGQGSNDASPFREIVHNFSFVDTGVTPIVIIPGAKRIVEVVVTITTPFNGSALTLSIGDDANNSSVVSASQTLLDTEAAFAVYPNIDFGSDTQISMYLTALGSSQGVGFVTIKVQQ